MALRKRSTWGYFLVCGIAAAISLTALILGLVGTLVISPMTELFVVVTLMVSLAALSALPYTWRQNVASGWRDNPSVEEPVEVTVSDEAVCFVSASGTLEMKWTAYRNVLETDEFLLLYYSAEWAHIVPKRAMSGAQLQQVRDIVPGHLYRAERVRASGVT
jgi:hypothetical protein